MGWWETLTAGQGTLLGAMFVVLAAVIAFSTGWLDRRIEQRRFHYNESNDQNLWMALGLVT